MSVRLHPGPDGKWLGMQGLLQLNTYCCGVTAGWMVMDCVLRGRHDVSLDKFYSMSKVDHRGLHQEELRDILVRLNVGTTPMDLNFGRIRDCISRGHPLVVTITHPEYSGGHYAVIYGYYDTGLYMANIKRNLLGLSRVSLDEWHDIGMVRGDALSCYRIK